MTDTKILKASDYCDCWYVPGSTNIIDMIHPISGLTAILDRDRADILAENPTALSIAYAEASRQIEAAAATKFKRDVTEIDEEKFWYALEVLPPVGWTTHRAVETFRMSERTWGTLTNIYARLGERYFVLTDDITLPAADIAARVAAFAAANPVAG
jgi:hypothetical protein